jgi:hypothetical protein
MNYDSSTATTNQTRWYESINEKLLEIETIMNKMAVYEGFQAYYL